jgi:hypothetical protein
MAERTFTLEEAQTLLPVLESLLRKAMEGKQLIQEVEAELEEVRRRIFLAGGLLLKAPALARRKAARDKAVQEVKDALTEIDAAGVQVKDLNIGLLDFPCKLEDRVVLLCWKLGETHITHWHETDAGFAGRQPVDDKIRNAKPRRR